jgi:deoxyribodipyrimidine photo-lyase
MPEAASTLLWFRRDLRLADNPALLAAVRRGAPVLPLFIWSPAEEGVWPPGAASRWWLHHSLMQLDASLRQRGSRLIIRQGPAQQVLIELQRHSAVTAVYWNRGYEPALRERDRRLHEALRQAAVAVHIRSASLLFEPETISTQGGQPYQVFSAFWRRCLQAAPAVDTQDAPSAIPAPQQWPPSLTIGQLGLLPDIDWAAGLRAAWTPGEAGALRQLQQFLPLVGDYQSGRDRPARRATSRLSAHVHFGEISVRRIWSAIQARGSRGGRQREAAASVTRLCTELGWREFAHHLLFHFPHTAAQPLRSQFAAFPWAEDPAGLRAWQRGRTGYPIVDAGMRELWHTGWMHNRLRMITASFLVKDLLLPWGAGARWFWDTLVDADLANNTMGWQWSAGCGADAAPYFRIFNPAIQGQKFDPDGDYVRRWVPELSALPKQWIHTPAQAPGQLLKRAGVQLGITYPAPIVDHGAARARALAALELNRGCRA